MSVKEGKPPVMKIETQSGRTIGCEALVKALRRKSELEVKREENQTIGESKVFVFDPPYKKGAIFPTIPKTRPPLITHETSHTDRMCRRSPMAHHLDFSIPPRLRTHEILNPSNLP